MPGCTASGAGPAAASPSDVVVSLAAVVGSGTPANCK